MVWVHHKVSFVHFAQYDLALLQYADFATIQHAHMVDSHDNYQYYWLLHRFLYEVESYVGILVKHVSEAQEMVSVGVYDFFRHLYSL